MDSIRVAAVQMDSPTGQKQANLEAVARLAEQAAGQGARIALFHEGLLVDYPEDPTGDTESTEAK